MPGPATLLVIGIHREEQAFGERGAAGLKPEEAAVLRIGEGLSGRHPRADQRFHYDTLHRELYHQLLAHVRQGAYRLVIDLHTGMDREGPCADIYCGDGALRGCVEQELHHAGPVIGHPARIVPFVSATGPVADVEGPRAAGVMSERVWNNPDFIYVGLEIYLPEDRSPQTGDWDYARRLVRLLADCLGAGQRKVDAREAAGAPPVMTSGWPCLEVPGWAPEQNQFRQACWPPRARACMQVVDTHSHSCRLAASGRRRLWSCMSVSAKQ